MSLHEGFHELNTSCVPACWGYLNPVQTSGHGCGHGCGHEHHQMFPVALRAGFLSLSWLPAVG